MARWYIGHETGDRVLPLSKFAHGGHDATEYTPRRLTVKKKPAGSLTRLPTGLTMENASRKESVCPLLWRASSLLRIARSIGLGWLGCRSERTGVTYHIRRESQEEIGTDCAFTNLLPRGGGEGGDRLWVDSCSGEGIAARSRAGPSIKFRGFERGLILYSHHLLG